jgi:hypothetical protein
MLAGLGIVGHKYGKLFVIEPGRGKDIREAYRVGPKGEWQKWIPTFIAICDKDHECEYTTVELYKEKCKQCSKEVENG